MSAFTRTRRLALAALAGAAFAVAPTLIASAHVSVSSADAVGGGTGTLAFRVPNESDAAMTTSLTVELPADTPFRSVRAETMPGWTIEFTRTSLDTAVEVGGASITEYVSAVTWTAAGSGIAPDEYAVFTLRVGPFPEEGGTFMFPATQTYDDGEVVAWAEAAEQGQEEPAHPAPTLEVAPGTGGGDGHGAPVPADDSAEPAGGSDTSDTTARVLGIAGIAVGVIGVLTGAVLGRRRATSTSNVSS